MSQTTHTSTANGGWETVSKKEKSAPKLANGNAKQANNNAKLPAVFQCELIVHFFLVIYLISDK